MNQTPNARRRLTGAISSLCAVLMTVFCFTATSAQADQPVAVPLDTDHWQLDEGAEIVSFDGRMALQGAGYVKDVSLLNGTIEADIWMADEINFAGFTFRVQSFDEQEWFWFRTHKTNGLVADGLQYAPAYRGVFCWQLNPQAIGKVYVPKNQWVHLKLKLLNDTAVLTVGDKPVMTVDHLGGGFKSGSIGLKTLRKGKVYFSNFSYQADEKSEVVPPKQEAAPPNVVTAWQLSPATYPIPAVGDVPVVYPAHQLTGIKTWITPEVEASGLVNITKYHGSKYQARTAKGQPDWTILRTFIDAKKAKQVKLKFGYSDAVTVFLNGVPLYSGNYAFLGRNTADGEWISFDDAVFLNLKKGRNELLAVVAEDFGGWGFQARLDDMEGIQLPARSNGFQTE